ncbi:MAG: GTPase HflX [Cytophagales bacterium]|jgi:GTP-binding protein HflX|nr:GTPase HflX [Cytophagales bacterium]MCA6389070.1 GTPase HflX [Cytophagales bacterium]MCA6390774.1 GTPase HflX [Cytophagales bacterium]MCA6396293.1 GTPase HflX [Cytophagales bacterium]MCA6399585.1 GTPase HflX [Cytophagales bacterium]
MKNTENKAVLIALVEHSSRPEVTTEHLDELAFLAETAGIQTAQRFIQRLPHPDVRTFVGKGKLEEIKSYVFSNGIRSLIFDDDLSPSQLRNIEKEFNPASREEKVRVYDRSLLILDIFVMRAQTAQARTQVELAMNQYLLPRLTGMWTHLERQRGGTGSRGGSGEKEIETDRRNIKNQISVLKEDLKKIDKQRITQRKSRNNIVRVSLVGYTNVGKSSLMNVLSKADVKAENKLFATVDATVRKVVIGDIPFLLSDTVGFIRKLPHHLIESFKSTLDEVREADLLIHVADIAHPFHDNHIEVVKQTLAEIGAGNITTLLVLNKIDLLTDAPVDYEQLKGHYREQGFENVVFVSAATKENLPLLKKIIFEEVRKKHLHIYPNYIQSDVAAYLDYTE